MVAGGYLDSVHCNGKGNRLWIRVAWAVVTSLLLSFVGRQKSMLVEFWFCIQQIVLISYDLYVVARHSASTSCITEGALC